INTATDQFAPAAAMDTAGNFLLLWYQRQRSPSIFARYFSVGALPSPMTVDGASPNSGDRGATNLSVDISGTGFTVGSGSGFSADFIISGTSTVDFSASAVNCTTTVLCTATVTIPGGASYGLHDIKLTSGTATKTGLALFRVKPAGG